MSQPSGRFNLRKRAHRGSLTRCVLVVGSTIALLALASTGALTLALPEGAAEPVETAAAIASLVAVAWFVWFIARRVAAPLDRGSRALQYMAAGDRDVRLPEEGVEELRDLARSFNEAIEELSARDRDLRATVDRFRQTFEEAPIGMGLLGLDGRWLRVNQRLCELVGYTPDELVGQSVHEITHPEDAKDARDYVQRLRTGEILTYRGDKRYVHRDGQIVWGRLSLTLVRNERDRPQYFIVQIEDVGEQRRAAEELAAAEERFRNMFEYAPIGKVLVNREGRIEQVNRAFTTYCGRAREQLVGRPLQELVHPADADAVGTFLIAVFTLEAEQLEAESRLMAGDSVREVAMHGRVLRDSSGPPTYALCHFQDIGERKRFQAKLQFLADHDPLTGLLGRRRFETELERHVARVNRYGATGALIVLDLDHFKQVNDTLGHNAGDELILAIAGMLRERLRKTDLLARLGGDEFAVLLPEAGREEAEQVAVVLVETIRSSRIVISGQPRHVTASVGVAMFDAITEDLTGEAMLVEADLAMYDAKEAGRDRYSLPSAPEPSSGAMRARMTWIRRIEEALEEDRFVLAAQPILDLRTGEVRQHELLLRMLDDHGDTVPPAAFLPIAERFGLIGRIDQWVSIHAIELIERHPELLLEVNISGRSLGDQQLLEAIENRLRESSADPTRLIFEVTETAAVANLALAQVFAGRLRTLGCRFALDDFGAGFGSFYYLKHLPFDYIKIDGEFVRHVATGRVDKLMIEAVVRIARGLGKRTIAEFVGDGDTLKAVERLGVDYAQGYHVGKPAPVSELLDGAVRRPSRDAA